MSDAERTIAVYREAAELNLSDPLRRGSLLIFPNYGQVVMSGDLHGHRRNFAKLQRFCDLEHAGARHVILHEIIHEEPATLDAPDMSHEVLYEAARWKCDYPDQVHFLLGNHDLAQLSAHEITKNGRHVTRDFEAGITRTYGAQAEDVIRALYQFIGTFPIAGRTPNRVFFSHSLPSPRDLPGFDPTVLERLPTETDLSEHGSVHFLVWGRYQTDTAIAKLREILDAEYFVCGHQPQENGYDVLHDRMIILASDHNRGVFLTLDLSKPVKLDSLTRNIRPLAAIL